MECAPTNYIFHRKKNDTEILKIIPGTIEYKIEILEESVRNLQMNKKIPECPV